jgi:hypothetical protein
MASSGKKKTTMAKLNRERKLRERRLDKQTRKDARKQASHQHGQSREVLTGGDDQSINSGYPTDRPRPGRSSRSPTSHSVSHTPERSREATSGVIAST